MRRTWLAVLIVAGAACNADDSKLSMEALQDPATCMECHSTHYTQWSGSMHAYSTDDPVFRAMNARGQRETHGALGTFCVQCHAPMAVALGLTDGTNLDDIPTAARGVTCYFCHDVKAITDTHDNPLVLANDNVMHGGAQKPVTSSAHNSVYDPIMDANGNDSKMCGSCHDVVTQAGVHLERTFAEWQTTFFSTPNDADHHLACGNCHMHSSTDVIASGPNFNVKPRPDGFHSHAFPGIDQALTPLPEMAAQAAAIKSDLDPAIGITGATPLGGPPAPGGICVDQGGGTGGENTVRIDAVGPGHQWPSGTAQDRRAWLEVIAYDATNTVVFQSGVVPDGVDPDDPAVVAADPALFGMWDLTWKDSAKTQPAHFFWEVQAEDPRMMLKAPVTLDQNDPRFDHSSTAKFVVGAKYTQIDHVTARIRIRPLPYAVLAELVSSSDLDPAIPAKLQTLDIVGTQRTWNKATAGTGLAVNTGCSPTSTK